MALTIRNLSVEDRPWVCALLHARWGSTTVVSRGVAHDASCLAGVVVMLHGDRVGLATYRIADGGCEVITMDSLESGRGVGRALIQGLCERAKARGASRLWLVTTNENESARGFYERCGLESVAVHKGAADEARKLKPEIPERSPDGVPIEDELEYELRLT